MRRRDFIVVLGAVTFRFAARAQQPGAQIVQIAPLVERFETLEKVMEIAQVTQLLEVSELHKPLAGKVVFAPRGTLESQDTTWVP